MIVKPLRSKLRCFPKAAEKTLSLYISFHVFHVIFVEFKLCRVYLELESFLVK